MKTTLLGKCPARKLVAGKLPSRELTFWETDLLGNRSSGKMIILEISYSEKSSWKLYSWKSPLGNKLPNILSMHTLHVKYV